MQHTYLCFLAFFILAAPLSAQDEALPTDDGVAPGKRQMSVGVRESFLVEFSDLTRPEAVDAWEDYVKPLRGKTKYNRKTKEYVTTGAAVPGLSGQATLYAKMNGDKNDAGTTAVVWISTPDGFTDAEAAHEFVSRYAYSASRARAQHMLEAEQDRLADLEKDLKRLRKQREGYEKDIRDAEETIADRKQRLDVNARDIEEAERLIELQQQAVGRADGELRDFVDDRQ